MKFVGEFTLPLFGELWRTEDCKAFNFASVQKLSGNESCFHSFSDTYVIGNEQPHGTLFHGHEQRYELIRSWLNGDMSERPERSARGSKTKSHGVAKQAAGSGITQICGVWQFKGGGANFF